MQRQWASGRGPASRVPEGLGEVVSLFMGEDQAWRGRVELGVPLHWCGGVSPVFGRMETGMACRDPTGAGCRAGPGIAIPALGLCGVCGVWRALLCAPSPGARTTGGSRLPPAPGPPLTVGRGVFSPKLGAAASSLRDTVTSSWEALALLTPGALVAVSVCPNLCLPTCAWWVPVFPLLSLRLGPSALSWEPPQARPLPCFGGCHLGPAGSQPTGSLHACKLWASVSPALASGQVELFRGRESVWRAAGACAPAGRGCDCLTQQPQAGEYKVSHQNANPGHLPKVQILILEVGVEPLVPVLGLPTWQGRRLDPSRLSGAASWAWPPLAPVVSACATSSRKPTWVGSPTAPCMLCFLGLRAGVDWAALGSGHGAGGG